ncbi:hypothetical protein ACOME3_006696 [Neoechinorhynchus agilis]
MIQFDATSQDSPTTYSDPSGTVETPNATGTPGLNSVHEITTLGQAISFARQTHDPYPMSRPVAAAMIQFDATSQDSPTTYSDPSGTVETPNATGTPGLNSVHEITTLGQAISFARQTHDPYAAAMIQFDATSQDSSTTYSDQSNAEETPNATGAPGLSKGLCPVCLDSFSITKFGVLRIHGPVKSRCGGSGQIPRSLKTATPENPSTLPDDAGSLPSAADLVRVLPRNILKRIPKGARYLVAKGFTTLLLDCFEQILKSSWTRLFAFPRLVLSAFDSWEESLTALIKRRLVSFDESFLSIGRLAKEDSKQRANETNCHRASTRQLAKNVSSKLADGDVWGAARSKGKRSNEGKGSGDMKSTSDSSIDNTNIQSNRSDVLALQQRLLHLLDNQRRAKSVELVNSVLSEVLSCTTNPNEVIEFGLMNILSERANNELNAPLMDMIGKMGSKITEVLTCPVSQRSLNPSNEIELSTKYLCCRLKIIIDEKYAVSKHAMFTRILISMIQGEISGSDVRNYNLVGSIESDRKNPENIRHGGRADKLFKKMEDFIPIEQSRKRAVVFGSKYGGKMLTTEGTNKKSRFEISGKSFKKERVMPEK